MRSTQNSHTCKSYIDFCVLIGRSASKIVSVLALLSGFSISSQSRSVDAIMPVDSSKAFSLRLTSQKCFYAGEEPQIKLTMTSKEESEVPVPEGTVHVECNGKEPPTTLLQRQWTHKQKPGEPEIREGGFRPSLEPMHSFTSTWRLSFFYDLTKPGQCAAYVDVADELTDKNFLHWLRSNTLNFQMKPVQTRVKDDPTNHRECKDMGEEK